MRVCVCVTGVAVHRGGSGGGGTLPVPGDAAAGARAGSSRPAALHAAGTHLSHVPQSDGAEQPHHHFQLGSETDFLRMVSLLFLHLR